MSGAGINTPAVFLAGWSSNNKYALLGAMRTIAMLISYEIIQVLALLGPVLFVSYAILSENPHILSVALSVIANYVTDLFKGSPEPARAKLSVVIETQTTKTTKTTTKKIDFDGPPDKIPEITAFIKDIK